MDFNELMFENVGSKIQKVAKVFTWVQIIGSCLMGFALFIAGCDSDLGIEYLIIVGPLAGAFGCFFAWLSWVLLYGFGKLIEDIEAIKHAQVPQQPNEEKPDYLSQDVQKSNAHQCSCGEIFYGRFCTACGKSADAHSAGTPRKKPEAYTPKQVVPTPNSSVICECGTRYYGASCPNCGRTK